MEQYIIISPASETEKKAGKYRLIKSTETVPPGSTKLFGPADLDACIQWINDNTESTSKWFWVSVAQYALIFLVTIAFVGVIVIGAISVYGVKITPATVNTDDGARILITFLIAVATVAIAILATLTAMIIREYKERFAAAKEVLTLLVGILGTIVGFYFGTASQSPNNTKPPANIEKPADTGTTPTNSPTPGNASGTPVNRPTGNTPANTANSLGNR